MYGCYASWKERGAGCAGYTVRPDPRLFVTAVLRSDASTTGMAGIMADQHGRPLEYWTDPIGNADRRWFRAEAGDSEFMPEFEHLAMLVPIKV